MKECPRCLFTEDIATIGEHQCNYCDLHDQLEANANPGDLPKILNKIRSKGRGKKYDCLIGISGGLDSSTLLYAAVRFWNLRPLVIHFDNGWNAPEAEHNMRELCDKLSINSVVYRVDKEEYDRLNKAFLWAGTPDCDIPNDIAMTKLMYETADHYGIKYILNGHDFRTEGSTPAKWTYMDARYIQDVYHQYTRSVLADRAAGHSMVANAFLYTVAEEKWVHDSFYSLKNYPLFTFKDQLRYALKGIKQVRPFHYGFDRALVENTMKQEIAWQNYGGKHCENIYTEYIGAWVLPQKFDIDKRRVYLSAQIRSGKLTKEQAKKRIQFYPTFDLNKIPSEYRRMDRNHIVPREYYDRYNFRRWRLVIWLLAKMKVVPWTMYVKYCKKQ